MSNPLGKDILSQKVLSDTLKMVNNKITIKKYHKESEYSYTLGITLTIELLKTMPEIVEIVYLHSSFDKNMGYQEIERLTTLHHIPLSTSDKVFNILSQKENCYAIGVFKKFSHLIDNTKNHIVLVNPSDAGNIGTIMRSAAGFGFFNIAIISPAIDIFNPKAIRSSMGAIFHLNIQYFENFEKYQNFQKEHTFYPFMLKAKTSLDKIGEITKPFSLIFGNEATGLPDEFLDKGEAVIINHTKMIDSLNLPIAVSIAIYEFNKKGE